MDLSTLLKHLLQTQWIKKDRPNPKAPILTRSQLQTLKAPTGHYTTRTSGATGIPVEVQKTNLSKLWWSATNLLETIWHKRDISQTFAVIRPNIPHELHQPDWGPAFALLGRTGPLYAHPVEGNLNAWLQKIRPGYLFTFPSILETIDLTALTNLKGIKTTGETLQKKHPLIADMYSCEEMGTIAIQCPDHPDAYHVMDNIHLEILDEHDQPAQQGRVILTDLTSHYLYRYEIGDYAEIGHCPCGRGLQTITKIMGRRRNQVHLPDGTKHWPRIGSLSYRTIAPIKRFQVAQTNATTLEFRHIIDTPLTTAQETALTTLIQKSIGYPFLIQFKRVDVFPNGKFEEFINLTI